MIDGQNFFDQPVRNDLMTYDSIQKIATGQADDYTTGFLLNYNYFKDYHKMIAIDLSKQINFSGNLHRGADATMFFIIEEAKETVLGFLQGTVKVF